MSEKVIIEQLIFRADGSVCGVGSSYEVALADGQELVASGKFKFEGLPIGQAPKEAELIDAEAEEDGRD